MPISGGGAAKSRQPANGLGALGSPRAGSVADTHWGAQVEGRADGPRVWPPRWRCRVLPAIKARVEEDAADGGLAELGPEAPRGGAEGGGRAGVTGVSGGAGGGTRGHIGPARSRTTPMVGSGLVVTLFVYMMALLCVRCAGGAGGGDDY